MKLYRTAAGRWVRTQADAAKDGKGWTGEDVPTLTKDSMIEWLNAREAKDPPLDLRTFEDFTPVDLPPLAPPTLSAAPPKAVARTELAERAWTATEIEAFILERASVAQIGNIFECLGTRFGELAKGLA
jgi:hypothetical protein